MFRRTLNLLIERNPTVRSVQCALTLTRKPAIVQWRVYYEDVSIVVQCRTNDTKQHMRYDRYCDSRQCQAGAHLCTCAPKHFSTSRLVQREYIAPVKVVTLEKKNPKYLKKTTAKYVSIT